MQTGELLQVGQRVFYDIKKDNVIEVRICVHTSNGVIRMKNSICLRNDNI